VCVNMSNVRHVSIHISQPDPSQGRPRRSALGGSGVYVAHGRRREGLELLWSTELSLRKADMCRRSTAAARERRDVAGPATGREPLTLSPMEMENARCIINPQRE
jgi:hypothetical protein